mmetsp:Transcript_114211/g.170851  ORF Transcript_114211/g.170851 Transcript_114211/m.170851 type:complete len:348 (+) Transcript_114211:160-1203(+)
MRSITVILLFAALFHVRGEEQRLKARYTEEERQLEYIKRGHKFPIEEYLPNTEGWTRLMEQRLAQVRALTDSQQKWDGWIQTLTAALTMQNFTEYGWGLTQGPPELTAALREGIFEGFPNKEIERDIQVIDGPLNPWFIHNKKLTRRVMHEMKPILEAWSGIELLPATAYGFRLYRNESRLWMHVDRTQTHVISCIYHIASSDNAEPWPIVIEDYAGNTNAVVLKPGDILLYESAKNFHGRPKEFIGDWYTSVFVHYYPKNPEWQRSNHDLDSHYAIPENWIDVVPDDRYPEITVRGTSVMEPNCPHNWCNLQDAIELEGPGVYGEVLTGDNKRYSLNLEDTEAEEL